jgi:hypothetical protein
MLSAETLLQVASDLRATAGQPQHADQLLGHYDLRTSKLLRPLLSEMLAEGATPRLMALMLEQLAERHARIQRDRNNWSFIWSGPRPEGDLAEDTFATVTRLVHEARSSLLLSTYNIGTTDDIRNLFETIATSVRSGSLDRFDLFFHPKQIEDKIKASSARLDTIRKWFYSKIWTWHVPIHAYVDSRLLAAGEIRTYNHAKVVIANADTRQAHTLVTSANLSGAGQRHNFEAGWLSRSPSRARMLSHHFHQMVAQGFYVRVMRPEPLN